MFNPSAKRQPSWATFVYASFLLLIFCLGLDQSLLFDVDEGAFTEATREMLLSGDWGHTTLNGVDRFDKPIGVYWLQALSASLWGLNEFAYRFPSAISGWIASLALAQFAYAKWGARAGITAGLIAATSLGPWAMARTATADALLGMFFVLIFLDLARAMLDRRLVAGRRVALWMGLGMLVKGPVAIVLPAGTLFIYTLLQPQARSFVFSLLRDVYAWIILLSVSVPWYAYAYSRHGQAFIDGFILKHNVDRFVGSLEGHSGHWAYFLVALPVLWMPWSGLLLRSFSQIRSQWQDELLKLSWVWFAFVFCFFSIANTKLPHYLLYAEPAVCLLLTYASLRATVKTWLFSVSIALLGFVALLGLPHYLKNHATEVSDIFYRSLVLNAEAPQLLVWLFALPLVWLIGGGVNYFMRPQIAAAGFKRGDLWLVNFAVFQAIVLAMFVLPWWSKTLQSPVRELAFKLKDNPVTVVQWGVHLPSFATYREQAAPRREPQAGELALVKNVSPNWPSDWQVIESRGPLSIVQSPKNPSQAR